MQYTPKLKQRNRVKSSSTRANESIVLAYREVLGRIVQLLSGIATAGFIVYALGWIRSFAYYDSFSADWLLIDLPFSELISRGLYPFAALLFGLLLTFTDVAKLAANEIRFVLKFTLLLLVLELIAHIYFYSIGKYGQATSLANTVLFLSASCGMLIFGEIVIELKHSNFKLNSEQVWDLVTALAPFAGAIMILGGSEGNRDKTPSTSTLAHVAIANTSDNWRLLSAHNDNLYLVRLTDELPIIKIIKADQAKTVVPHKKNVVEKLDTQEPQSNAQPNNNAINATHKNTTVKTLQH